MSNVLHRWVPADKAYARIESLASQGVRFTPDEITRMVAAYTTWKEGNGDWDSLKNLLHAALKGPETIHISH